MQAEAVAALTLLNDAQLMARVGRGDKAAYSVLLSRHLQPLHGFAYRMLGDADEAEDAVQNAFVNIWVKAQSFDADKAKFSTWAYRIVMNQCLDAKRKRRLDPLPAGYDAVDEGANVELEAQESATAQQVQKAIKALPERQHIALTLCHFEGQSNAEAAVILGVGVKALESLLSRARATLKETLGDLRDDL